MRDLTTLLAEVQASKALAIRCSGALQIVAEGLITVYRGWGRAKVSSLSGDAVYTVDLIADTCDCRDYSYNAAIGTGGQVVCKHLVAAWLVEAVEAGCRPLEPDEQVAMVQLHLGCIAATGKQTSSPVCGQLVEAGLLTRKRGKWELTGTGWHILGTGTMVEGVLAA